MGWLYKTFTFLLLSSFAIAFGGFTFYVSIVVPIGTEILGSPRAQGEITQQVTHWLNLTTAIAVGLMLVDCFLGRRTVPLVTKATESPVTKRLSFGWKMQLSAVLVILLSLGVLVWLHPQLDLLIEGRRRKIRVTDRESFYHLHRVYLWVSTVQWLAAWVWLGLYVARAKPLADTRGVD